MRAFEYTSRSPGQTCIGGMTTMELRRGTLRTPPPGDDRSPPPILSLSTCTSSFEPLKRKRKEGTESLLCRELRDALCLFFQYYRQAKYEVEINGIPNTDSPFRSLSFLSKYTVARAYWFSMPETERKRKEEGVRKLDF